MGHFFGRTFPVISDDNALQVISTWKKQERERFFFVGLGQPDLTEFLFGSQVKQTEQISLENYFLII